MSDTTITVCYDEGATLLLINDYNTARTLANNLEASEGLSIEINEGWIANGVEYNYCIAIIKD